MRAAEFLRGLADMLAAIEDDTSEKAPVIVNVNNGSVSTSDNSDGKFVPPLQQKLELLKKSAGVKSVFDQEAEDDEPLS